jgi:bifunctional non-homologous end joining protein LigD
MPLLRLSEAFDHPDWLFELKHDGFRALAVIELCRARFISRQGYEFKQWPQLSSEVSQTIRARRAVLDGEIVCLRPDGLSDFYSLMFRRGSPYFYAFDLLELDGEDLRGRPLFERKRRLAKVIPFDFETRLRLLGHVPGRGRDLFRLVCDHDVEGIVAKWCRGTYHVDGRTTSWLKIKNPSYSQAVGRHEAFEGRGGSRRPAAPVRRLDPTVLASLRGRATSGLARPGRREAAEEVRGRLSGPPVAAWPMRHSHLRS